MTTNFDCASPSRLTPGTNLIAFLHRDTLAYRNVSGQNYGFGMM